MGTILGRPTLLPAPAFALKAALGEFSTEVLSSARVVPAVLERAGFTWQDPRIEDAIRAALN
jgi:NAD dependent epimerase/dehydratase family enzyme